jgi:hypothetical protein
MSGSRNPRPTLLDLQQQVTTIELLKTDISLKNQTKKYAQINLIITIALAAGAILSGFAAVLAAFHRPPTSPVYIFLNPEQQTVL